MTFSEYPDPEYIKGFRNPMTQLRQECPKKKNWFCKQNNNFAYASNFFVYFFAALALYSVT